MQLTMKKTSLEESENVVDTLQWKLSRLAEENKLEDYRIGDYIAQAIGNLENKLAYIDESQKLISDEKKAIKAQIEKIKVDGAKFLADNGVDKLDGLYFCSSVSIMKGREESTDEYTEQEFTLLISDEEVKELLLSLGKAEMRTIHKSKTTAATADKLRINKRKVKQAEVIEK